MAEDFISHLGVLDRMEFNKLDEAGKENFLDKRKQAFKIKVIDLIIFKSMV